MPTAADSGTGTAPEEFCADEVKVFKDEGEDEQEQNASESLQAELLEEKSSLITESETGKAGQSSLRPDLANPFMAGFNPFSMGYLNPYASLSSFLPDPLGSPPPAHMQSLRALGAAQRGLYPPYPYPSLGMEQLAAAWHYQQAGRASMGYPFGLPPTSLAGRLPHGGLGLPGQGIPGFPPFHPAHSPHHMKQEFDRPPGLIPHPGEEKDSPKKKEPHIKKPLNAFMLYMKEMRPVVQAECTLKESAAINQILGRRWHGLTREEQSKYYEKARQARQLHLQMYPHWNARDNYRFGQKKKKRKRDKSDDPAASMKKCRARYGLDQQNLWCKPCRRKKKCIRVQMYLAGRTEQEIENTRFDEEGECIPPLQRKNNASGHGNHDSSGRVPVSSGNHLPPANSAGSFTSSSNRSDEGGSPASQGESSNAGSLWSPATPGGLSLPSLGSPASIASPSTPGGGGGGGSHTFDDSYRHPGSSHRPPTTHRPPVGSDPRDSKNPLSISSLTSSHSRENLTGLGSPSSHHHFAALGSSLGGGGGGLGGGMMGLAAAHHQYHQSLMQHHNIQPVAVNEHKPSLL